MAHVQVTEDSGLHLDSAWSPGEATDLREAQDGSGRVCGSGQSVVGLSTAPQRKNLA